MPGIRPIDANALKDAFAILDFNCSDIKAKETGNWLLKDVIPAEIDDAPTLDYAPVVRCKDCLFYVEFYCKYHCGFTKESDYCSRAKKKGR